LAFSAAGFIATSTSGRVARREDVARGEVDLERGHARDGAGGRADLGREVGSVARSLPKTAVASVKRARKLHPVAGVPRHPHDDSLARLSALHTLTYAYVVRRFQ
jgi:hypothetical protein